ncbi:MAG: nitrile hydratase subunit beta [Thiolinea sp.]
MDGIHDLGGKQGFGPVKASTADATLDDPVDAFGWTMNQTLRAPGLSIDWWRHIRELTPPVDYLTRPYFDQWVMTQLIAMIDTGALELDEVLNNKPVPVAEPEPVMSVEDVLTANREAGKRFDTDIEDDPRYQIGDSVLMRNASFSGHSRLPNYVLGKAGVITAHHGAHYFPDACAHGDERAEHLYTVEFTATELWPQDDVEKNLIYLDLWESYFVDA